VRRARGQRPADHSGSAAALALALHGFAAKESMMQTRSSSLAPAAEPILPVVEAQSITSYCESFAQDGYLVFRDVVPRERLVQLHQRMQEEFERAKTSGRLFSGGGGLAGHLNCSPGEAARFAYDALVAHGILDVIKAISAEVVRLPNVGCNFNLPGSVVQHWHMDRPFTKAFMIANVAVVDTNVENGATDVIPGSHRRFYPFWEFALQKAAMRLANVRVPLRQGDVLVRTSSLWHRGMPNRTAAARPMLAFTWEDGGSTLPDPFQAEGGGIVFRPNWYRPDLLGRLRERTYVAAPFTYDAWRVVHSLFGKKGYDH
jgi:ectoine hydroxylase-related dioxygenase (phytanoyl-CoA dioxygenase family)